MTEDNKAQETALRLKQLVETADLSGADKLLAERCRRRLEQPLRLTVFGNDPKHAISLLNLMIGQPVVSPSIPRARIHFFHDEIPHARLQFRDGSQERIEGAEFRKLFDGNPIKVRICVDLPVLRKISILVSAEPDADALCSDFDKTLPAADIALWAGAELRGPMADVWKSMPERLRDHSYLVLSPTMSDESWEGIADEFVDVLHVDPRRAQEAKSGENGVDKVAFRDSGGAAIVKTIKKEIDVLVQSAIDAGEVLLMRHADELTRAEKPETPVAANTEARPTATPDTDEAIQRVLSRPAREYSVPLGKLASRSRLLNSSSSTKVKINQRTVSMAIKNMPKNVSRPISKTAPKSRVRSRATPWSMGI